MRKFKVDTKTEDLSKLKQQNRELKKQLRAARKELDQANHRLNSLSDLLEETEDTETGNIEVVKYEDLFTCPKCQGATKEIPAGPFVVLKCQSCTWRKRV